MKSINVLLVEDNEINQVVAGNFLRKWGIGVTIARHGKEALDLIASKIYNLVLMDLQMPEMDGYESTSRIRAMEDLYFKTVPILAFTASSLIDSKEKAIESGMTDFIGKPLIPEILHEKITKYTTVPSSDKNAAAAPEKTLSIDFERYTDGDADFKSELVSAMIADVDSFKNAVQNAFNERNKTLYDKAVHKATSTLSIINDKELTDTIEELKSVFMNHTNDVIKFSKLCDEIMKALSKEINK